MAKTADPNDPRGALPRSKFARHIDRLIQRSGKQQNVIAHEMGYERPNIISMFKLGVTRVPLDKVPALAAAIDADPADLTTRWLAEFEPNLLKVISDHLATVLSENEKGWVERLRGAFPHGVPAFDERHEEALKSAIAYEQAEVAKLDASIAAEAARKNRNKTVAV